MAGGDPVGRWSKAISSPSNAKESGNEAWPRATKAAGCQGICIDLNCVMPSLFILD